MCIYAVIGGRHCGGWKEEISPKSGGKIVDGAKVGTFALGIFWDVLFFLILHVKGCYPWPAAGWMGRIGNISCWVAFS